MQNTTVAPTISSTSAVNENTTPALSPTAASKSERLMRFQKFFGKTAAQPAQPSPEPLNTNSTGGVTEDDLDKEVAWFVLQSGLEGVNLGMVHNRIPEFSMLDETERRKLVNRIKSKYGVCLGTNDLVVNGKRVMRLTATNTGLNVARPAFFIERDEAKKRAAAEARQRSLAAEKELKDREAENAARKASKVSTEDRQTIESTADLLRHLADRLDEQAEEMNTVNERKARFDALMLKARESSANIQNMVTQHNALLDELQTAAESLHQS